MTWAVVGTLLGAVVGVLGTLATQRMADLATDKRERLQRREALNLERKNEINEFLEAAQEAERVAGDRDKCDSVTLAKAHSALWTHHKRLMLICPDELVKPLNDYANILTETLWHGPPEGVAAWEHVSSAQWWFGEAARKEIKSIEQDK